jgi:RNA polymerase sigma-70 factor (ECF subfamily)
MDSANQGIMQRLVDGDREALGELYDRYAGAVGGIARRILKDDDAAEDVVQTVFIQAWRQASRYDVKRGSAGAWLSILARTRALDALRRRTARRETPAEAVREPAHTPMPVEHMAVHQALSSLPDKQRRTLELAYYQGFTHVEIAKLLGEPLGTIKTRTRVGLQRLRAVLQAVATPERTNRSRQVGREMQGH